MLKRKSIYSGIQCEIYWDQKLNAILVRWNEFIAVDSEFKSIFQKINYALKQSGSKSLIFDVRHLQIAWEKDRKWLLKFWYPEAISIGLGYQALIVNPEDKNESSFKNVLENYNKISVATDYVQSMKEAVKLVQKRTFIKDERLHYEIPAIVKRKT